MVKQSLGILRHGPLNPLLSCFVVSINDSVAASLSIRYFSNENYISKNEMIKGELISTLLKLRMLDVIHQR